MFALGSINLLHKRMMGIKKSKLFMEFAFIVARLAIWTKNCVCLDCLTVCYTDSAGHRKKMNFAKIRQNSFIIPADSLSDSLGL